jgi:protein required for attachment to host cells
VFIIAPPRALGELRQHYGNALPAKLLGELAKEHTHDSAHVLEQVLNEG